MKKSTIIKFVSGAAIGAAATAAVLKCLPIIRDKIDNMLDLDDEGYDFDETETDMEDDNFKSEDFVPTEDIEITKSKDDEKVNIGIEQ